MKRILFSLLFICSSSVFANSDIPVEVAQDPVAEVVDTSVKDAKIATCVVEYVKKQSKSYSRLAQENLYDLIHNFDRIVSKVYGKTPKQNDTSMEYKIMALAKVQCELYYAMGVLK